MEGENKHVYKRRRTTFNNIKAEVLLLRDFDIKLNYKNDKNNTDIFFTFLYNIPSALIVFSVYFLPKIK